MPDHAIMRLACYQLPHAEGLPVPRYETALAAGLDLPAAVPHRQPLTIKTDARMLVPTGLVLAIPAGFEGQIRPRSGLALRHGVTVLNAPGTVDADYRGEVKVLLVNLGNDDYIVRRGERIAQLVIAPVHQVELHVAARLDETGRGSGGFGSTGGLK